MDMRDGKNRPLEDAFVDSRSQLQVSFVTTAQAVPSPAAFAEGAPPQGQWFPGGQSDMSLPSTAYAALSRRFFRDWSDDQGDSSNVDELDQTFDSNGPDSEVAPTL